MDAERCARAEPPSTNVGRETRTRLALNAPVLGRHRVGKRSEVQREDRPGCAAEIGGAEVRLVEVGAQPGSRGALGAPDRGIVSLAKEVGDAETETRIAAKRTAVRAVRTPLPRS
jgi:hypothetical protein